MTNETFSGLWKAAQLAWSSTFFPTMVRAAAMIEKQEHTQALVEHVASSPAVQAAIPLTQDGTVDSALIQIMSDPTTAGELDELIKTAVANHQQGAE